MRNLKFCFNELAFFLQKAMVFTLHIALVEAFAESNIRTIISFDPQGR